MRYCDPIPSFTADLNRVLLIGALCEEPEVRELGEAGAVCFLRLNCLWRQPSSQWDALGCEREPQCVNVLLLGHSAASIARYLYAGRRIVLDGALQSAQWEDRGACEHEAVCVLARRVEFLGTAPEWVFGRQGSRYRCGDFIPGEHSVGFSEDVWL